jgi:hypothetical protein
MAAHCDNVTRYVSGITFIRYVSGITFIRYAQDLKIGKPNNIKVFVSTNAKGHKQDSFLPGVLLQCFLIVRNNIDGLMVRVML